MKKVTGITLHRTGEGERLSFTYSEISPEGKVVNDNKRENFIVLEENLLINVKALYAYCNLKLENDNG